MKCKYIKSNKEQCQAQAIHNSEYCFRHDQSKKVLQLAASQKGGEARKLVQVYGEAIKIETPQDIKVLLGLVIKGVWEGRIPAGQPANTIGFLARCFLDAYEKSELEERLLNLEKRIGETNL
jgi:hypothetical protein